MNLNKLSDKIVFNSLKFIKHGNLKITNHDGKEYTFGNSNERLNADLKINKPGSVSYTHLTLPTNREV